MIQTPTTVVPDPANPQSLNRYSYGLNNPVSYTDPTGHNAACASLMGGGPLGGLAALVCEVGSAIVSYWPQVQALAVEAQQLAPFAAELPATVDPNLDSQPASPSGNAGDTGDPGGLDPNDPWSGRLLTSSETRILADGATHGSAALNRDDVHHRWIRRMVSWERLPRRGGGVQRGGGTLKEKS